MAEIFLRNAEQPTIRCPLPVKALNSQCPHILKIDDFNIGNVTAHGRAEAHAEKLILDAVSKVDAVEELKGRSAVDFVIFTVKGQDTKAAAELIEPIVGPRTAIISFQNGVEWLDILSDHFSSENMIPGTTITPAAIEEPGVIRHIGSTRPITIGELRGEPSERLQRFSDLCSRAGLDVTVSENIRADIWTKFVGMATMSALACLTRLPVRRLVTTAETRELAGESMDEIIALAAARGVELPAALKSNICAIAEAFDPAWKTSMCNDLEAGKPIEVDSLSGAIHRLGLEHDVPTTFHSIAYKALKPYAGSQL